MKSNFVLKNLLSLVAVVATALSFVGEAKAYTYNIQLSPATSLNYQYVGRFGFFASDDVYRDYNKAKNNFTFLNNVVLSIDNVTGNATVRGTMYNNTNSSDLWTYDLALNGLVFKDKNGQFFHGNTKPYDQMIADILKIPASDSNQVGAQGGYGIEWTSAQLTITDLNTGSQFNGPTTYTGKNDPGAHHPNVAELHNFQGKLFFGNWFMANSNPSWFADTKAWGTYLGFENPPVDPPTNPVPEPTTLALLSMAGIGMVARRKRNKV